MTSLLIPKIQNRDCKARAELEVLLQHWEAGSAEAEAGSVSNKNTVAYAQAVETVARHRTRTGQRALVQEQADSIEETLRPFVYLGLALGELDRR
jgi:hypothetical protein